MFNTPVSPASRLSAARLLELVDLFEQEMTSITLLKRHLYSLKTWARTTLLRSRVFISTFCWHRVFPGNVCINMKKKATLK
jgi:hypothetical protein